MILNLLLFGFILCNESIDKIEATLGVYYNFSNPLGVYDNYHEDEDERRNIENLCCDYCGYSSVTCLADECCGIDGSYCYGCNDPYTCEVGDGYSCEYAPNNDNDCCFYCGSSSDPCLADECCGTDGYFCYGCNDPYSCVEEGGTYSCEIDSVNTTALTLIILGCIVVFFGLVFFICAICIVPVGLLLIIIGCVLL